MHHSEALHVEMFWDPIFHIMKWVEGQSGLLNSVTLCRCGRVNERWLINLHTGVRFHVFHSHPRAILKQYELMRPHQFFVDSVLAVVVHIKVATHSRCEFCSILL